MFLKLPSSFRDQSRSATLQKHVPTASERGFLPWQGVDFGHHEPQREAGRVRGAGSYSAAGGAAREGAERGKVLRFLQTGEKFDMRVEKQKNYKKIEEINERKQSDPSLCGAAVSSEL